MQQDSNQNELEHGIDTVEFKRVSDNKNILYISNIPAKFHEDELQLKLEKISQFGLLYEVVILDAVHQQQEEVQSGFRQHLGLIKFYSAKCAAEAIRQSAGRLFLKGNLAKVKYARRKKTDWDDRPLYVTKCYELANHYLGFNGWSSKIIPMTDVSTRSHGRTDDSSNTKPGCICYTCRVEVDITRHNLCAEGYGVATIQLVDDPDAKGVAVCRARKQAYQHALEDAFSKIIIIILPNGKVYPEVNTTVEETLHLDEELDRKGMLQVNELEAAPCDDSDEEDIDEINQQILMELESKENIKEVSRKTKG